MRRRQFLSAASLQLGAFLLARETRAFSTDRFDTPYGTASVSPTVVDTIAGTSVEELLAFHRRELFDVYLPPWEERGIDWEYGGFFRSWTREKFDRDAVKQSYDTGRGFWMSGYFYNNFGKKELHLKAALRCEQFLYEHCRTGTPGHWESTLSREGKPLRDYDSYERAGIDGDIYIMQGFTELYRATGRKELLDEAIANAHFIMDTYVSPSWQHLFSHGKGTEPGFKKLETWQHFLGGLTPLARVSHDYGVEMIARACVRNLMERHWLPEYGVFAEYLDDQFNPILPDPEDVYRRFSASTRPEKCRKIEHPERESFDDYRHICAWHSIQAAWICMDEALRIGNRKMFLDAMEMGRLTLEKCWIDDDEHGGLSDLDNPEGKAIVNKTGYPTWARLDDTLVFLILSIEHTHSPWALYWYDKVFTMLYKHTERISRNGMLHYPRRFFYSIKSLENMLARGGRVSDFLEG